MKNSYFLFTITAGILLAVTRTWAHDGHVHAEAPGAGSSDLGGIIHVTEQGKKNLGIEATEAQVVEIENTMEAVVEIVPIPTQMAVISSRIPGMVKRIHATAGQAVKEGKPLVVIESFKPGDPPPTVAYPAPLSGLVMHWDVAVGESVEPNGHLAEIVNLSEVYAEFSLFEGQLNRVQVGQPVRVIVESFPGEQFEGQIELLGGSLDPETRSLKAFARIKNQEGKLRPHMRGLGHIVIEKMDAVIGIPHRAITGDPGNLFVFVQTDTEGLRYEQRPVVLGAEDDRFVEVIEGVLPAEPVVVSGNYQLQFVERKAAIPEGGGHGHDHGPSGEHLAGEDHHGHGSHHGHRHGSVMSIFTPPFAALGVGLLFSLGLNAILISRLVS
ncbi:MAG: efflux RND transporter periplasmic adaptor subunit [Verrucomicrobiota bacterium]